MPTCVAFGCNNKQFSGCGKTFHRFPHSDAARMEQWVQNVRRKKWQPSKKSVLCSEHFEEACFDRTGQTVRLRESAVPTLFNFPKCIQKTPKPPRKDPAPRQIKPEPTPAPHPDQEEGSSSCTTGDAVVQKEHVYSMSDSPIILKRKLDVALNALESTKKKLKYTQQKSRRLEEKIESLKRLLMN
ncbi:PREDICTED: THAP domain-containing protein 1 A-like [Cyprinodon variegatus]|uniref:THAP domain-containing protein 1 A-like n=1 Tax=Cyprinodon variegatus TaxID=28743 RepID=A0A3Q2GHV8_CYPVA|nr:PREDICTED: THAP domain-containing protein 1 A-like [Cyprinodon variegatus]